MMEETPTPVFPGAPTNFQKERCSNNIRVNKRIGTTNASVYVTFGSEVDDDIRLPTPKNPLDVASIRYVSVLELVVAPSGELSE
jgi:hypothetical protein